MNFRPTKLSEIVGQEEIKQRLRISISAAKQRNEVLQHILADGQPGVGKTTLAYVIANELDANIQIANGANLRSIKSLLPYLARIQYGSVLFIDEIHRTTPLVQEFFYPILEDFRCDIGKREKISIDIPRFTLIGATTNSGELSKPLYDRFPLKYHLELYSDDELSILIKELSGKLNTSLTTDAIKMIAASSRGTPRVATGRLQWIRDYALSRHASLISDNLVKEALDLEGIAPNGMDKNDVIYLGVLKKHRGRPLGVQTISSLSNISLDSIENTIEPFLLRLGLIMKTPKGRILA